MRWDVVADCLVFSVQGTDAFTNFEELTKRKVTSISGKFNDPLGFLSPMAIRFCNESELIIQEQYNTICHTLCTNTSRLIYRPLPPLWDMPNYYYMYSLSSGSELIKPILYRFKMFFKESCEEVWNQTRNLLEIFDASGSHWSHV